MARGWESKAVEDQMQSKESETNTAPAEELTPAELQLRAKRESLLLARTRIVNELQSTRNERYRKFLDITLADLDLQISALERK